MSYEIDENGNSYINTKLNKRARNFCITDNNYGPHDIDIFKSLTCIKYGILGKEVGQKGTPHLQGYVQLFNAKTIKAFQKVLKNAGLKVSVLIAKGNWEQNSNYCSKDGEVFEWGEPKKQGKRMDLEALYEDVKNGKDDIYLQENHTKAYIKYYKSVDRLRSNLRGKRVREEFERAYPQDSSLREWQKSTLSDIENQNDRTINWIFDPEGNKGKTWLAKYLVANNNAYYVRGGKMKDIAYAYNYEPVVIFDFSKSQEDYINYMAIESFKDGMIFSSKYESCRKYMAKGPKVIIFSNFYPDLSQMSQDRWQITSV